MKEKDLRVGAISTYLEKLERISRERGVHLFYRGHSKKSFKLGPKIYRNNGWIANEAKMFKELVLRCPDDFGGDKSTFESLVKMQHYGLPTRLMDITSNPLVALHFACEVNENDDEDGEVIIFGFDSDEIKYFDSDTVSVLANLCRRPADFQIPNSMETPEVSASERIKSFNSEKSIELLNHDVGQDKPHFKPHIEPKDLSRVICVKSKLDNPRIVRQEGGFLLYGCNESKCQPAELADSSIVSRIVISRDKKKFLSGHLEALGVSHATLFPEIDDVAGYLTDLYEVPTLNPKGLTENQREVIAEMRKVVSASPEEVASAIGKKAGAASQIIARLYEKKLVEPVGSGRMRRWKLIDALMHSFSQDGAI